MLIGSGDRLSAETTNHRKRAVTARTKPDGTEQMPRPETVRGGEPHAADASATSGGSGSRNRSPSGGASERCWGELRSDHELVDVACGGRTQPGNRAMEPHCNKRCQGPIGTKLHLSSNDNCSRAARVTRLQKEIGRMHSLGYSRTCIGQELGVTQRTVDLAIRKWEAMR